MISNGSDLAVNVRIADAAKKLVEVYVNGLYYDSSDTVKISKEAVLPIESDTAFSADIESTESVQTVTTANEVIISQTMSTSANKIISESENSTQDTTIEN